ncbi:hypothetical protein [Bifidobacterium aquikefiri]|uniref:hypothetical protein n=1 Tax=Bifidobacterium aquikefiri TaxID=1653207 RepID=UPI0039EB322F
MLNQQTNTGIPLQDLADSSSTQQRWISEPTSRIALSGEVMSMPGTCTQYGKVIK